MSDAESQVPFVSPKSKFVAHLSRRSFVRRGGLAIAVAGVGVSSLLAACGSSKSSTPTAATTGSGGSSSTSTSTATSQTSTGGSSAFSTTSSEAGAPQSGGTLKWGFGGGIATLDPHVSSSRYDYQVESHLFDQLVIRDQSGNPTPSLATKWEISTDGLEYTFSLKSGVKFHDGTAFNAASVKYNFDRMVNPDTKSEQAIYNLGPYDHTEVVDDATAKVGLKSVFAPLLIGLAEYTMGMVSTDAAEKAGKDFGQSPVGTGPFKFKEWIQNDHVTIVKNPDYNWAPAIFSHNGPPYLDALVYQLIKEEATRTAALQSGQVDLIMPTLTLTLTHSRATTTSMSSQRRCKVSLRC